MGLRKRGIMIIRYIIFGIFSLILLSSCSDPNAPIIENETKLVQLQVDGIKQDLSAGTMVNAAILKSYIDKTLVSNPEYKAILTGLAKQYTINNSNLLSLEKRLAAIPNTSPSSDAVQDLANLKLASNKDIFNQTFIDEINTVAALSNGALKPLNVPDGKPTQAGQNLVGNPSYGKWQTTSSGSIWAWYGQYAFFSSLFRPPYYNSWYYNRPWSYGYDRYNNNYGSRSWKKNEVKTMDNNYSKVREYGKNTNRKPSAYASRTNSSVKASATGKGSSLSSVRSSTAKNGPSARKSSPYSSSSRSGTRSRSSRGGK